MFKSSYLNTIVFYVIQITYKLVTFLNLHFFFESCRILGNHLSILNHQQVIFARLPICTGCPHPDTLDMMIFLLVTVSLVAINVSWASIISSVCFGVYYLFPIFFICLLYVFLNCTNCIGLFNRIERKLYNLGQNICRLFHVLAQLLFTASKTELDYYDQKANVRFIERLKASKIPDLLGFYSEYPAVLTKDKEKAAVKHSIEKTFLLNFVNLFTIFWPRLRKYIFISNSFQILSVYIFCSF